MKKVNDWGDEVRREYKISYTIRYMDSRKRIKSRNVIERFTYLEVAKLRLTQLDEDENVSNIIHNIF